MATYINKEDKRNTSTGLTPNKSIRRPTASAKKTPPLGGKSSMRRPQGR